jgi:hypothetical protein
MAYLRHSFLKEVATPCRQCCGFEFILFGWIRIQEGKKTHKREKSKVSCFDVLDALF